MIHFTNHAIDRYRERVKPWMKRNHVRRELCVLVEGLTPIGLPPLWVDKPIRERVRYVEVTDGIAFVCMPVQDGDWLAVTCLIRAGRVERKPKPYRHGGFTGRQKRIRRNEIRRAA